MFACAETLRQKATATRHLAAMMAAASEGAGGAARKTFALVVAATDAWGIGKAGGLPWRLKGDMAYFKKLTSGCEPGKINAVIMGRKTWDSVPSKFRPLPGRLNIVLTRSADAFRATAPPGVVVVGSLEDALAAADERADVASVFVIGGASVYADALKQPRCGAVYLTLVSHPFECDTFMPPVDEAVFQLDPSYTQSVTEGDISYEYRLYTKA